MMPMTAMLTRRIHKRTSRRGKLHLRRILLGRIRPQNAQRLQRQRITAGTLEHHRIARTTALALGRTGEHPHEYPNVKVGRNAQQRPHIATVSGGRRLDRLQQNAQRHFVARLAAHRHRTVLDVARLRSAAGQHRHIGGRHAQQPTVGEALDGTVQEPGRRTVRIQVHHAESLLRLRRQVHQRLRIGMADLDQVVDSIVLHIVLNGGDRLLGQIVGDDASHAGDFVGIANAAQSGGGQRFEDDEAGVELDAGLQLNVVVDVDVFVRWQCVGRRCCVSNVGGVVALRLGLADRTFGRQFGLMDA